MLASTVDTQIIVWVLQGFAGLVLTITMGLAIWALRAVIQAGKDIVSLQGEIDGVNIKINAETKSTDERFDGVKEGLKAIFDKLDTMNKFMMGCPRLRSRPCPTETEDP